MKNLLVINAGSSQKHFVFGILKETGVNIIVANSAKLALPEVDDWIITDTSHHDSTLRKISDYNKKKKIDGVLTFWEDDVLLTAKTVDLLGVKGISYQVAQKIRNKYLFREFCVEQGIPSPKYMLINSKEDLKIATKNLSFPMVIKPVYGSSSAFVTKVEDAKELERVYDFICLNISADTESALHEGIEVLLEEYIDGDEVDIDVLVQNGKIKFYSITDNSKTEEPFFVETGDAVPSLLSEDDQDSILRLVDETLEKAGISDGCIHFEAKVSDGEAIPIEVNLRMGGGQIHMYVKEVWGVDLVVHAKKIALDEYFQVDALNEPLKYVASRYFLAEKSGVLANFNYDDAIEQDPFLLDFQFFKSVGDSVFVPPEGYEYLGWIVVAGVNPNDAADNLQNLYDQVEYSLVEFEGGSEVSRRLNDSDPEVTQMQMRRDILKTSSRIQKLGIKYRKNRKLTVSLISDRFHRKNTQLLKEFLEKEGYDVIVNDVPSLIKADIDALSKVDFALVMTEKTNVTALLDTLQIPFLGSQIAAISLAQDEIKTRKILDYHSVPMPEWDYVYSLSDTLKTEFQYPVQLKTGFPKAKSNLKKVVANDEDDLDKSLKNIFADYGTPVLVEELIDGNKVEIFLTGNYPNVKVHSMKFSAGQESDYDEGLVRLIKEIAVDAFNLIDCYDFACVEMVVDEKHNPYFLKLNSNPLLKVRLQEFADVLIPEIIQTGVERIISGQHSNESKTT